MTTVDHTPADEPADDTPAAAPDEDLFAADDAAARTAQGDRRPATAPRQTRRRDRGDEDPFPPGGDDIPDTFRSASASTFERVPPCNLEAEQVVLGGMMLSKDAIYDVVEALKPFDRDAFYRPAHATIYDAIIALYSKSKPVNPISVGDELGKMEELAKVGGQTYLHTLVQLVPTAAAAEYEAGIVLEKAKLRELTKAGTAITQMGYAGAGDADDILDQAAATLAAVTSHTEAGDGYASLGDVFAITVDDTHRLQTEGHQYGILTGFTDLDAVTFGLHPGQMIVIAARPGMGKSTLAVDIARHAAIKCKRKVAFFSLEMNRGEIAQRIMSAEARVALHHIRGGNMTDDDWTRIARRTPDITEAPMTIYDTANATMTQIGAQCRRQQQREGLDLVVVDYLQLMQSGGTRRAENRQQEVSDMSRNLKLLAKELGVPVIALSQLNRGPEQRTDKKPVISDLRESGSIEQDADVVILLHREDAYEKESPRAGEADLILAKHRNGPTATISVAFQGHYSRFVDMAST